MATNSSNTHLTLVEVAKRTHNNAMVAIAEILHKEKPAIQHADWVEATDMFSNITTQRYSLPSGTFRRFNAGVASETSKTRQIVDQMGMLESYAEHDQRLVDKMPNPAQFRNDENVGFIEGLGQTWSYQLFYGNALVDPEKWTGLAPRMAALNSTTIQGCGGTGSDVSSIYLVKWSPQTCHMIRPRGATVGLQHEDLGVETKVGSDNTMYQVYRDHFMWDGGLVVRDPKGIGRIANIETSGSSNIFSDDVLIDVVTQLRGRGAGFVGYCSLVVYAQILKAIKDKTNVFHSVMDPFGKGEVPSLLGIPIYPDETILNTETAIA